MLHGEMPALSSTEGWMEIPRWGLCWQLWDQHSGLQEPLPPKCGCEQYLRTKGERERPQNRSKELQDGEKGLGGQPEATVVGGQHWIHTGLFQVSPQAAAAPSSSLEQLFEMQRRLDELERQM